MKKEKVMTMKKKLTSLLATVLLTFGVSASALAAEAGCMLGWVNMPQILQNYPGMNKIMQDINAEKARIQKDVNTQAANLTDDKAKVALVQNANKQLAAFEQSKLEPVQKKIKRTIDKVAKSNNIQSVVSANIMVSGGKDLTAEVIQALNPQVK